MKILLSTLHAKYAHASLALPCLAACCQDLPGIHLAIREWTIHEPHEQLLRQIIAERADVIAFSCYIWNVENTLRLVADIKQISHDIVIVLGGPEVSFGTFELMHANLGVDYVIKGEGEQAFRKLLLALKEEYGSDRPPAVALDSFYAIDNLFFRNNGDIVSGPLNSRPIALDSIPSPFQARLVDLRRPLTYYETSRGCPFSCAFCLSSVEGQVRSYAAERIEADLAWLMGHKVPQIKLVDRTFNYDARRANQIWEFILAHNHGSHFHFEIAADLLTEENLLLLSRVPPQTFRFEIGVQSVSQETLERVERRADLERICANVTRLRDETQIELHLDLVAGLPGEGYHGLLDSLQQVFDLKPHVIQIEPLKVLKGSGMREIARKEGYRYSQFPPYTILRTPWLSFEEIGRIETIGRLLDLFHNQAGFTMAWGVMLERFSAAELFHRMALQAFTESLAGRTTRRVYELFAHLAAPLLPQRERHLLFDALFYDYCLREMPLMGKLPSFIADRRQLCAWPGRRELPEGLAASTESRIKAFRFTFDRDYRDIRQSGPATLTFVYASGAGRGLTVTVL